MRREAHPLIKAAKRYFGTYNAALIYTGIDKRIRIKRADSDYYGRSTVRQRKASYKTSAKIVSARRTGTRVETAGKTQRTITTRVTGAKRQSTAEKTRMVKKNTIRTNNSRRDGVTKTNKADVHYKAKAKKGQVNK